MSAHRKQPPVDGFSVGSREVINNLIPCKLCGEHKSSKHFTLCGRQWSQNCKPCESDRVAMNHLRERIAKYGRITEVISIQREERELAARKDRLRRLIEEQEAGRG